MNIQMPMPMRQFTCSRGWKRLLLDQHGRLKPEAARVLADLHDFCEDDTTRHGGFTPVDNEMALAYTRRRETLQRIMNFLRLEDHELAEIQKQRNNLDD